MARRVVTQPELDPRAIRLLRNRRRARLALLTLVLLLVAAVVAVRTSGGGANATDHDLYHQRYVRVVEVLEGDTLRVALSERDRPALVRLIGVDSNGSEAARAAAAEACGEEVLLYLEVVPTRNHAGDLMGYVFARDGTLVNGRLIEVGHAFADRRWDYTYLRMFLQLEEQARQRRRGMWDGMTDEQMPEWRRRWLAEQLKEPWKRQEWRRRDEP